MNELLLNEIANFLTKEGTINKNRLTKSYNGKDLSRRLKELNPDQSVSQTIWDLRFGKPLCIGCHKITPQFKDGKYLKYCGLKCSSTHNGAGKKLGEYVKTVQFKKQRSTALKLKFGTDSMATLNLAKKTLEGYPHPLSLPENQLLGLLKRKEYFKTYRLPLILESIKKEKDLIPINNGLPEYNNIHSKYKWKHITCGTEFEGSIGSSCLKCKVTVPHQKIIDLIYSLYPSLVCEINNRTIISPQEIDIYFPELKLGIEVNGIYWHSERAGRGEFYHLKKTEKAESVGLKLLQITEDEIYDKWDIVVSRIKSAIGKTERIYARKCKIIEVDTITATEFIEKTHIQGSVGAKLKLGLIYEDKLIALMTFGRPRFNKKYDWELLRYCTELGITVVGGASKLLKEFRRRTKSGKIISYADRRWSNGSLYRALGFTELNPSAPSYIYTNKFTSQRINRFAAQKHKLPSLLGESFNPDLSEFENMIEAGFDRTFDCGNRVFELNLQGIYEENT